ncbi:MAG: CoA transferase subunit A, partial [Ardenticatenaceae bacterium]
ACYIPGVLRMAIDKVVASFEEAVTDIPDGATLMIDGFAGPGGTPQNLIRALRDQGAKDLTIVSNTAGLASVIGFGTIPGDRPIDIGILVDNEQVKKIIASFPVSPSPSRPTSFEKAYREGEVGLELVPQGTLAERIRAGGAGIPAFYTPTSAGTELANGKETRVFDGRECVLERALKADFALLRAHKADTLGNVIYRGTSRNFNGVMATAASVTVMEVDEIVEPGGIDFHMVHTPGIYVDRIVKIS